MRVVASAVTLFCFCLCLTHTSRVLAQPEAVAASEFPEIRVFYPINGQRSYVGAFEVKGEDGIVAQSDSPTGGTSSAARYLLSGEDEETRLHAILSLEIRPDLIKPFHFSPIRFYVARFVSIPTELYPQLSPDDPGSAVLRPKLDVDQERQAVVMEYYQKLYFRSQRIETFVDQPGSRVSSEQLLTWCELLRTANALASRFQVVLDGDATVDFALRHLATVYEIIEPGWNGGPCKPPSNPSKVVMVNGHSALDVSQLCTNVRNALIYEVKTLYNSVRSRLTVAKETGADPSFDCDKFRQIFGIIQKKPAIKDNIVRLLGITLLHGQTAMNACALVAFRRGDIPSENFKELLLQQIDATKDLQQGIKPGQPVVALANKQISDLTAVYQSVSTEE